MALAQTAAWAGDPRGSPRGQSSWPMPPADMAPLQQVASAGGALHGQVPVALAAVLISGKEKCLFAAICSKPHGSLSFGYNLVWGRRGKL